MLLELQDQYRNIIPKDKMKAYFSFEHVVLALLLFDIYGAIGRTKLARMLGLGRGSLRTFLHRLKNEMGLLITQDQLEIMNDGITSDANKHRTKPHVLTQKGKDFINDLKKQMSLIGHLPSLFDGFMIKGTHNAFSVIRPGVSISEILESVNPLELVDKVRQDGNGGGLVSFYVAADGKIKLLGLGDQMKLMPKFETEIIKINEIFPVVPGNIILMASSSSELEAKLTVISATIEVLKMLEKK
jgi:hypothetical protein